MRRPPATETALTTLRSVCHELRPPVATLGSLVRELEHQQCPVRRDELARLATEHAVHIEALLTQAAATAYDLDPPPDHALPLHRILPAVATTVPSGRLTVSATPAAMAWPVAPRQTRQILINLLGNAVRHGPASGRIRLQARTRRRRLLLTVADEGSPTRDLRAALRRAAPPEDSKGLGLWVVRHLGGSVHARRRHHGLAVEVTLPRQR
jgi:signal transduction histidine kinase